MKFLKLHPVISVCLAAVAAVVLAAVITGVCIMEAAAGNSGEFDYLILLGTAVEGTEPSAMLADRIATAASYLQTHPDVICIVSGYQSGAGDISEAQCMFNELTAMGISAERIILEEQATSTKENLKYSLALIEELTGSRPDAVGIVSSELHLYRAGMFADEQKVAAYTIPARTSNTGNFIFYFLREIVLVWYYSIF